MKNIFFLICLNIFVLNNVFAYRSWFWHTEQLSLNCPQLSSSSKITSGMIRGVPYIFYIGSDQKIYALYKPKNQWVFYRLLSSEAPLARKDSKLIYGVVNGIEHVFYIAEWDNRLHDIYFQPETFSTGWSPGWNTMNFTVKPGSDIKLGIVNGVEYCFYVGDDSRIHAIYYDRSIYGFKGGNVLSNELPTVKDNSNIEFAVANNIPRIFFVAGYDNEIHDCYYQPQNFASGWSPGWSPGWSLGWTVGNLPQVRVGSKLEYRNIKNKQYLFFVSNDNKIHYLLCSNGTWLQNILRTDIPDVALGSDLETGLVDDGDYLFFVAGYDSKIHDVRFDSNGLPISPGWLSAGYDPTLAANSPISFLNINNDEYVIYLSSCDGLYANWKQNDVIKKIDGFQLNSSYEFDTESNLNEVDWDKHPAEGWLANPIVNSGYPKNYLCNSNGDMLAPDNSNHEIDTYSGYINLNIQNEQNGYWGRVTDYGRTPSFYGYKYYMTTAALISKKMFKYGYFEIRCMLPNNLLSTDGANFWLYGNDGKKYNEIDVFETESTNKNNIPTNYHWGTSGATETDNIQNKRIDISKDNITPCMPNLTESFHTYGVDWQPDKIVWYLDNKPIRTVTTLNQLDLASNFFVPVKIFVDDAWRFAGKGYPNGFKDKLVVDYVRVYDKTLPISETGSNSTLQNNWDVYDSDGSDYAVKFFLPTSSSITASTNFWETNFDTKIEIFKEDGTRTGYYNDDSNGGLKSEIKNMQLDAGYYYVVVDGYNGYTGNFRLNVDYSSLKSDSSLSSDILSDSDKLAKNTTSTEIGQLNNISTVYPNPVNDVINILNTNITEDINVTLTDMTGKILKSLITSGEHVSIDVSDIKPGFYIVTISSSNQDVKNKIQIIR